MYSPWKPNGCAYFAVSTAVLQQSYVIHRPAHLSCLCCPQRPLQVAKLAMEPVKAELNKLMQQRSAIEAEIKERTDRLNEPGMPGMSGSLLDKEGFPRSDIDIHAVRTDRNAIIRLTNDHKQISSQLEQLLHKLHALARESGAGAAVCNGQAAGPTAAAAADTSQLQSSSAPGATAAASPAAVVPAESALRPFAVVDEVADGSPAAAAGVQLGDQVCRFGAAVAGSGSELQHVAQELQQHEGQEVSVLFMRAGHQVQLTLVPRKWEGRGLLGCHLRPL